MVWANVGLGEEFFSTTDGDLSEEVDESFTLVG